MVDVHDDSLGYRFLLGDVTPLERTQVEQACETDTAYFESLCALEEDMLVRHLRGELPAELSARLMATLPVYSQRRRRLDELAVLRSVLQAADPPASTTVPAGTSERVWGFGRLAAAAVVLLAIGGSLSWLSLELVQLSSTRAPSEALRVARFPLVIGQQRSGLAQTNVLRVPRNVDEIHLEVALPFDAAGAPTAALRRVGEAPVAMPAAPMAMSERDGRTVATWRVAAATLVRGDYLLTISDRTAGASGTVATAFFSVIE